MSFTPLVLEDLSASPAGGGPALVELAPEAEVDRSSTLIELAIQRLVPDADAERTRREQKKPTYAFPPVHVVRLTNGSVESDMCIALSDDGRYIRDSLRSDRQAGEVGHSISGDGVLTLVEQPERRRLESAAALVGLPVGGNYFHWLFEGVARGLAARAAMDTSAPLLVQRLSGMERQALLAAGMAPDDLYEMPPRTIVSAKELVVPSRGLNGPSRLSPWAAEALHRLAPRPKRPDRRLFISRQSAGRRRIANEAELQPVLTNHGFEIVQAEQLPVRDQWELFASASAVVGMHGAGMTNAVFQREGTLLIELQPPRLDDVRVELFWNLAALRKLRYVQIVCAEAPGQELVNESARHVEVNPDEFDELLSGLLP